MEPIKLPSGSELRITPAPFADAKALFKACMEETKDCQIQSSTEVYGFIKDLVCTGLSSRKIEAALDECMKRCIIDGKPVSADTFEAVEKRQDYIPVVFEVLQENISPFLTSLYAKYYPILDKLKAYLA